MSIEFALKLLAECLSPNDLERSGLKRFIHESIRCMEINWNAIAGLAVFKNTGIHERSDFGNPERELRSEFVLSREMSRRYDPFFILLLFLEKKHEYLMEPRSQLFYKRSANYFIGRDGLL